MAEQPTTVETEVTETVIVRAPLWQRVAKWVLIALVGLAALLLIAVLGLNTGVGKRLVVDQIGKFTTASGLNVKVGRIEGSVYGAMVLRDVRVSDPKGVFATSPSIAMDWRPFSFLNNHVDIRSLRSPLVRVGRLPELIPGTDPNAPMLPDLDIDIGSLNIDRLVLEAPVAGQRHIATVAGEAKIADRRAQVIVNGRTLGNSGGDRLALVLDAVPDDNKFDLRADLAAPVGGLVAGLAKLEAPLTARISGRGGWDNWQGRAVSTLGAGQLADLAITARKGAFQVRGVTQPGLYLKGPVERLASPNLQVALDAVLDRRRVDTRLRLRSSAMALTTTGTIDLGKSAFDQFRVEAMLLTPGAIAPNLNGRSVIGAVALNGPFATPTVDYKLQAAAIGFGETVVERLYAEGLATVNADRILIPVKARAGRVSGLNAAAGGLLTNVTIAGDLAITGTQILSENLRIRSDRIDATAIIAADMSTGRYTGALKGRVNDYVIDSIGIVNLETDADLYAAAGGWGIKGRIVGRSTRLFNAGVRDFLGGNAILRVNVALDPSGIIQFSNLKLAAPQFKVLNGSGRYDPAGALLLNANGYSNAYGPVTARVTGSLTAPVIALRAPRPGVGVGLVDLNATIRGRGDAYAIIATGGTNYGPFTADVLVRTEQTLTVDVRTARFAGTDISGQLRQTPAGPFAGALSFVGSGINGNVDLSAAGKYQQAVVRATASNATIPGDMGITIGRAIINATAILYDDAPAIVGDAQVANLKSGAFVLTTARAKIDYRGGRGSAQALAEGSSGVPFRIAANAKFEPELWLVALGGKANGINFNTAQPARIAVSGNTYRLAPARIDFDQGSMRLAGTWGDGLVMQARLDKLDLSVANALYPGLGLGGSATGSLDFRQPTGVSFPQAVMRLNIAKFTRSSLAGVSAPVDVAFVGRLLPDGSEARAVIKRGPTTIGRLVATLQPTGAGGWSERLMAGALSGGIRYNGPSAVLFSLGGFTGQQLSGPVAVAADFSGQLNAPQITGIVRGTNLVYENEVYGTRLSQIKLEGRFDSDSLDITELNAVAGNGRVIASGTIGLSSAQGFPIDITARFRNARLARSNALGATATGQLRITNGLDGGLIEGRIIIPEARYQIIRQGAAEVPELTGVYRKSELTSDGKRPTRAPRGGNFKLNISMVADNRLFVSGMGLESEWSARMQVTGTSAAPIVTGEARVVRGTYSFASRRFELTRGIVSFEGGALTDPQLNISASTTAEGVTAIINIGGTGQAPNIAFTSTPTLPQDEVLSRLLFGNSVTNLSATEAIQLAAALNSLRGSGGGLNPLGSLRSAAGIDRLRILGEDDTTGRGMALAAGQYITDDIYIEIITDARGFTAVQLEIALTRALSLLSQTGSFGGSRAGLKYSKDY